MKNDPKNREVLEKMIRARFYKEFDDTVVEYSEELFLECMNGLSGGG